jgi:hypothetical protein
MRPTGQVGPHPSLKPIAPAYLQLAMFIQTSVMWAFTRLPSSDFTRACGVNSLAPFTHPQTKSHTLITAPTPPNPLQQARKNAVMWNAEEYAAWYELLSNIQG